MKKIMGRICCVFLAAALILTGAVSAGMAEADDAGNAYAGLFDQSRVHTIDIEIADWDAFVANADAEEYAECNVTIDGERLENVAIRAKGNTSLSSVRSLGSSKYSFKIEFDHYDKELTYHGLDKLSLNNLIYDATMMKDYLAYTLMAKMNVPASMCSFAWITVNGEDWSLYLAVEAVEDSFMERYGMTDGELYKPDSMSMDRGDSVNRDWDVEDREEGDNGDSNGGSNGDASNGNAAQTENEWRAEDSSGQQAPQDGDAQPADGAAPEGMPAGENQDDGGSSGGARAEGEEGDRQEGGDFGGSMGMGGSDVKLQYIDDDPESYPNIFDNAKTKVGKKDKARLIEALKTLNSENATDAVFYMEVIRYFAVHDFLQNGDSYTGSIIHNYYLYEENGKLAILPWDYNLAFGGMGGGGDATSTINSPIDSPVDGSVNDRPLLAWIFSDEEALETYHQVYDQFITEVVESGWLEEEIDRVATMLLPYLEKDKNSFFSVDAFDVAVQTLQAYCRLRGESIRGQLDGTIPSTSEGQNADRSALIDASSVNISSMGSMNGGGGQGGGDDGGSSGGQQGSEGEAGDQQDSAGDAAGQGEGAPAEQQDSAGDAAGQQDSAGDAAGQGEGAPAEQQDSAGDAAGQGEGAPAEQQGE